MSDNKILRKHRRKFRCKVCKKSFDTKHEKKSHKQYAHSNKSAKTKEKKQSFRLKYPCPKCEKGFSSRSKALMHICSSDRICREELSSSKFWKCMKICQRMLGYQEKLSPSKDLEEVRRTCQMQFKCHICSLSFPTKHDLKSHKKIHRHTLTESFEIDVNSGDGFLSDDNSLINNSQSNQNPDNNNSMSNTDNGNDFACLLCKEVFSSNKLLVQHCWQKHLDVIPVEFFDKQLIETTLDSTNFNCNVCEKEFKDQITLNKHLNYHFTINKQNQLLGYQTSEKNLQCGLCLEMFDNVLTLDNHVKFYHKVTVSYLIDAKIEEMVFQPENSPVDVSLEDHHDSDEESFLCDICGEVYRDEIFLECHKTVSHSVSNNNLKDTFTEITQYEERNRNGTSTLPCNTSSNLQTVSTNFTSNSDNIQEITASSLDQLISNPSLQIHNQQEICSDAIKVPLQTNGVFKAHGCDICELNFSTFSELVCHKQLLHKITGKNKVLQKPFPTERVICNRILERAVGSQQKLDNRFKCPKCNIRFRYYLQLSLHNHLCGLDNRFECEYCGKIFRNAELRKQHVASSHISRTVYRCKTCKISFYRKKCFQTHKQTAHLSPVPKVSTRRNRKTWQCKLCVKAFEQERHLIHHIRRAHNITYSKMISQLITNTSEPLLTEHSGTELECNISKITSNSVIDSNLSHSDKEVPCVSNFNLQLEIKPSINHPISSDANIKNEVVDQNEVVANSPALVPNDLLNSRCLVGTTVKNELFTEPDKSSISNDPSILQVTDRSNSEVCGENDSSSEIEEPFIITGTRLQHIDGNDAHDPTSNNSTVVINCVESSDSISIPVQNTFFTENEFGIVLKGHQIELNPMPQL